MRAKGLEFPEVILYRFGESVPEGFDRLWQSINVGTEETRL